MKPWIRIFVLTSLLAGMFAAQSVKSARAASIVVNSAADAVGSDGFCTLREAIANANSNSSIYADCTAGDSAYDTITFAGDYTITLSEEHLYISTGVIINGNGIGKTIIQANANPGVALYRVFYVDITGILALNDVTVRNGRCVGNCAGGATDMGGGIYNDGTLTMNHSEISGNRVSSHGGGIYNDSNSTAYIENSIIKLNAAMQNTSLGGGIASVDAGITVTDSVFFDNIASTGGGMLNYGSGSNVSIINVSFIGNDVPGCGGGLVSQLHSPSLKNVLFSGNTAGNGGAMCAILGNPIIEHATFSENSATVGGALYNDEADPVIKNSIFWGNYASVDRQLANIDSTSSIYYSNVQGCGGSSSWDSNCGTDGGSNVDINPQFVDADGADNLAGSTDDNLHLQLTSSLIDAGNNALTTTLMDLDGKSRFVNIAFKTDTGSGTAPIVDMGAYETGQNSFTSNSTHDGWVLESTEMSGAGGSKNNNQTVLRIGDDSLDRQYRSILSFNTTSIPDSAVVTSVVLQLRQQGVTGGGNPVNLLQGFMIDIKKGAFGTSGLQLGDFKTAGNKSVGPFTTALSSGWYTINLTSSRTYINKTGLTQIRARFKKDDNDNAKANFLSIYSGNSASKPQLIVDYYEP